MCADTDSETQHMQETLDMLEARIARTDRAAVEQETLDEHPLLPGSLMHYLDFPNGMNDFPGLDERMERWRSNLAKGLAEAARNGRRGFNIDYANVLPVLASQERVHNAQMHFMDVVACNPNKDVVGYWFQPAMRQASDALLTLCANSQPQGFYVDNEPANTRGMPFAFTYADLDSEEEEGRFATRMTGAKSFGLDPVFYMIQPRVAQLLKIRTRWPRARIVAIATPAKDVDLQCAQVLRAKLGSKKK